MLNTTWRRFTLLLLIGVSLCYSASSQPETLRFKKDGKFKIVQFTDVHFKYNNKASDAALECINEVLKIEKPDLVVFTGDVIYAAPADKGMREVMEQVAKHKIPFAVTFGNHDDEFGASRAELYDLIREIPYNLLPDRGASPSPDYVLEIQSSANPSEVGTVLYCMDSNTYSTLKDVGGYGWFSHGQIDWYRKQSAAYTARNKNVPLNALAFFHIPLPEYSEAVKDENVIFRGTRMEKVCAPQLNSGMFTAMLESGDVMGTFVGHDHDDDYAVMHRGVLLAYGRFTGGNVVYNHLPNGARVIELREGKRAFTTWIRQRTSEVYDRYEYPEDFMKDDWKSR